MNLLAGTACPFGIDMGFNTPINHANGQEGEDNDIGHCNEKACKGENEKVEKNNNDKENGTGCCDHHVVNLSQTDKAIPEAFSLAVNSYLNAETISFFYSSSPLFIFFPKVSNKYFVRSHHPPIPDIRIAIQSFQI